MSSLVFSANIFKAGHIIKLCVCFMYECVDGSYLLLFFIWEAMNVNKHGVH